MDPQDNVFNAYIGPDGDPVRVAVGKMGDLVQADAASLGGVPVDKIARLTGDLSAGRVIGFSNPEDDEIMMPPTAPITRAEAREGGV